MELREPLMLLLLLPAAAAGYYTFRRRRAAVKFSGLGALGRLRYRGLRAHLEKPVAGLLLLSCWLLAVALAGPRKGIEHYRSVTEGVDIVLCVDVSGSMSVNDMAPDRSRLELVKDVVADFIDKRRDDNMGLVVFANRAYRLVPLTGDRELLKEFLKEVSIGMVDESRTAVGDGLARALDVVKSGRAKSKAVVLLSDGANNAGVLQPETAAEAARALGVRCYAVGAGTDRTEFRQGRRVFRVDPVDEEMLTAIADKTGGRYFRAEDAQGLAAAYREIDRLEKTEMKGYSYRRYREYHPYFAAAALACVLLYAALSELWVRRTA